jgi:hypothetical protein
LCRGTTSLDALQTNSFSWETCIHEHNFSVFKIPLSTEAVDMNGRFQMQGGKNWFLPKEMNANRSFGNLIGWKSGQTTFIPLWDRMEGAWLWTLVPVPIS